MTKRKLKFATEPRTFSLDHAQVTGDTTTVMWQSPAGRAFRITRVVYNNPTGLAAAANDYYTIKVLNGVAVAAQWSTQTTGDGALVADTPVEPAVQVANMVVPANTKLSLSLDLTGTATLPAGRVVIEGDLL